MTMMAMSLCNEDDARVTILPPEPVRSNSEEADHRIANSLQLLSAMVALEARDIADPAAQAALDLTNRRIAAIAGVHRQLYRARKTGTVDLAVYLGELGRTLGEGVGRRVIVDAAPIAATPEDASAIGIIVSELVTNACKYAYPVGAPGNVQVTLRSMRPGYLLTVEDRGRGLSGDKPAGTGFGARLVEAMAARLGGYAQYRDARPGTRFVLRVGAR